MKKVLIGIVVFLVALFSSVYGYLNYLKPTHSGGLPLADLKDEVEVLYDNYAIPHIYAKNEEDLFYAFGYVHAQDRLFQMEMLRRLADGRLSELFGEKALESDKFFRTLSLRQQAKRTIDSVYKDPKSAYVIAAKAYVKGVNEYIKMGKTPIEFTLAGIPKTEYTLEDMEIIMGYMGYTFVQALKTEAVSTAVMNKYGPDYFNDIFGGWPDGNYKIPDDKNAAAKLSMIAEKLSKINKDLAFPPFHGSNGWVLSGSKTQSGKPILSNDTHIAYSQPSVWYEAHLECPTFKVYGNFLAGIPAPALGHNDAGGWGLTMFENDDADFYRETLNPQNPNQVKFKDKYENLEIRDEIIKVKGKADVVLKVKKSRHGYILNGAFEDVKSYKDPIAFWWIFQQFPSRNIEIFYNASKAKNIADMGKAVKDLTSPGLNFMYADTLGNIGWWAAGKLPIRPKHVNPILILDGASGNDEILGWNDFSKNPQIINPERGVLYSANNQPDDMGNGLVPGYYVPSDRAKRIEELIFTDKKDWTEESLRNVINDVKSTTYPEMCSVIMNNLNDAKLTEEGKKVKAIMQKWDGTHELNNLEPTVFYKVLYNIYVMALKDEMGKDLFEGFPQCFALRRNTKAFINNENSKWWDNVKTPAHENRKDIFTAAFNQSILDLNKQLGDKVENWNWRKVHTITHKHPLGILPVVGKFFNVGPIEMVGGRETINNMAFEMDSTGLYNVTSGPALRRIIDFKNPELGYSINPTGQSGNFMSSYYRDQAQMFADGKKRPELTNRKDIEKVMIGKLVLKSLK